MPVELAGRGVAGGPQPPIYQLYFFLFLFSTTVLSLSLSEAQHILIIKDGGTTQSRARVESVII